MHFDVSASLLRPGYRNLPFVGCIDTGMELLATMDFHHHIAN